MKDFCDINDIQSIITSKSCLTGTDRVYEFSKKVKADYYINVQGDEPIINPKDIEILSSNVLNYPNDVLMGFCQINDRDDYFNDKIPKILFDNDNYLIYSSRSPIPGNKNSEFIQSWKQVCVYSFPYHKLNIYGSYKNKTKLELIEDLEILRFLEIGIKVKTIELSNTAISIDEPDDIEKLKKYFI